MIRITTVLFILLFAGCTKQDAYVVSMLDVEQVNWDTLQVAVSFAKEVSFGNTEPAKEDSVHIIAFNAAYDTLFSGSDALISLPDRDLGNNERILLEVCGTFKQSQVCEQASVQASPKRVRIEPDIIYPIRNAVYQGKYELPFIVERAAFGSDAWETINRSASIKGYILAYVEGRENESIKVPFKGTRGGFNLANLGNYKDFKFYLDSALLDHNQANVKFDIYVDMDGFSGPVSSITKDITLKSEEEHHEAVAIFAQRAADEIVDKLNPFLGRRRNVVYIDEWHYNTFKRMYGIEMEVRWSGTLFTRSDYRLSGVLEVYEEGKRVLFRMEDADRRTLNRWESRVEGNALSLSAIDAESSETIVAQSNAPFKEENGVVVIEAEHVEDVRPYRGQSWQNSKAQAGFRGDGALVAGPEKGVRIRGRFERRSPEATYNVSFSNTGTYYVWLRVWADSENNNSVHVGINDRAQRSSTGIETSTYRSWTWMSGLMDDNERASLLVRKPGIQTLNLWMREDGLLVDRILMTTDPSYVPSGNGPNESVRINRVSANRTTP